MQRSISLLSAPNMALVHGAIYLASGLWPVIHIRSFEKVTGPKVDKWLVKTVGLLIASTGGALLYSGVKKQVSQELVYASAGQALSLGGISLFYSLKRRISKVYLFDVALEALLFLGQIKALQKLSLQNGRDTHSTGRANRNESPPLALFE